MRLLFFLGHPAHFHLFKNVINRFIAKGDAVKVIIIKKDILEDLVRESGWDYFNIAPEGRRNPHLPPLVNAAWIVFKTEWRMIKVVREFKPQALCGTEHTLAHTGKLFGIPAYLFNEDDTHATPYTKYFYPFATKVIMPECTDRGKWPKVRTTYKGYHELAYLAPDVFTPDKKVVQKYLPEGGKYFILRLAELSAAHDVGKTGITDELVRQIIEILRPYGRVCITAERVLKTEFEEYRLAIDVRDIHHFLAFAEIYIGDSQTMAAEAAVLGTPSIRYNDFIGKLEYLNELEEKYDLTRGISTGSVEKLLETIPEILSTPDCKSVWKKKAQVMLKDKMDVNKWIMDFLIKEITSVNR